MEERDYDPVQNETALHTRLNMLIECSLPFGNYIGRLPDALLMKIFSGLPMMSLMTMLEVEKRWREVIDDESFDGFHFETKESKFVVGISYGDRTEIIISDLLDDSIGGEVSAFTVVDDSAIIGSIHGFLVTVDPDQINIINPVTKQFFCYLKPYRSYSENCTLVYGFGKTIANVYKLLVIKQERQGDSLLTECMLTRVGGEAEWRTLLIENTYEYNSADRLAYVNSNQHWLVSGPHHIHPNMVSAFNFDTEDFRYFSMPYEFASDCYRLENKTRESARILDDKLCVCLPTRRFISIWKMEDYGDVLTWMRTHVISTALFNGLHHSIFPVYLFRNSNIILLKDLHEIVIYSSEEEELDGSEYYQQVTAVSHQFSAFRLRENDHGD